MNLEGHKHSAYGTDARVYHENVHGSNDETAEEPKPPLGWAHELWGFHTMRLTAGQISHSPTCHPWLRASETPCQVKEASHERKPQCKSTCVKHRHLPYEMMCCSDMKKIKQPWLQFMIMIISRWKGVRCVWSVWSTWKFQTDGQSSPSKFGWRVPRCSFYYYSLKFTSIFHILSYILLFSHHSWKHFLLVWLYIVYLVQRNVSKISFFSG